MAWSVLPVDSLLCMALGISITVWLTLLLVFIIVPAVLGVSFGIRRIYMNALLKVFEWATLKMEQGAKEKNQHLYKPYSNGIIAKEPLSVEQEIQDLRGSTSQGSEPEFEMADIMYFSRRGMESIVDDEVTKRFSAQELESWNLLTRSNYNFRHISLRLTVLWGLGLLIRYGLLLPLRVTLAVTGIGLLLVLTTLIGFLPHGQMRSLLSEKVHVMCYRICVRALTAIITYHHRENKPKNGGICVANHTTPIDVIILANDGCYSMVGQIHGGLMGLVQRAMVKSTPHIWFERSEVKDRHLVAKRLNDHVSDKTKLPILIFPEGTCINNTSVMMFKKGSFEIGCTVYPVAIKYDPRFGDAFWNSSKFGMVSYLLRMMSSWAIVCSVWYLPPMEREEGEDAVQFANRVKAAIAIQGGLVDLLWDGGLKRGKVKDAFKEEQQKLYSRVLMGGQEEDQTLDRPGEERDQILDRPGEERDQILDRPGEERDQILNRPGEERDQILDRPGEERDQILNRPGEERDQILDRPGEERDQILDRPGEERDQILDRPGEERDQILDRPGEERDRILDRPGEERDRILDRPGEERDRILDRPGEERDRILDRPGEERDRILDRPGEERDRILDRPGEERDRILDRPGEERDRILDRPGEERDRILDRPGEERDRILDRPGEERDRILDRPGEERDQILDRPGEERDQILDRPGEERDQILDRPGEERDRILDRPGEERDRILDRPGEERDRILDRPGEERDQILDRPGEEDEQAEREESEAEKGEMENGRKEELRRREGGERRERIEGGTEE